MKKPTAYRLQVTETDLADLKARLGRTRWPDEAPGEAWHSGTSVAYLRDLCAYWQKGFDWRAAEARLNAFPQFMLPVNGIDLHFIHAPSKKPGALPLLLSHGWPGSVFEFLKIIPLLQEHFTLVAPSLPKRFCPGRKDRP